MSVHYCSFCGRACPAIEVAISYKSPTEYEEQAEELADWLLCEKCFKVLSWIVRLVDHDLDTLTGILNWEDRT